MLEFVRRPEVALFLALALGHLIGRLRVGPISLGGICGTLIVSLIIGQAGVTLSPDLKNVAFALFIFALGFTAGPQFFANIRSGWRYGILSVIEVVTVVALLAAAVVMFSFDPGTTAGLLAGSATESAVIGTASEALGRLGESPEVVKTLESNIATAYSITYLFGLVAIVVFTTQIAPLLLRINLRDASKALAREMGSRGRRREQRPARAGRARVPSRLIGRKDSAGVRSRQPLPDLHRAHSARQASRSRRPRKS